MPEGRTLDLVFPSSDGSVADHANTVRRHFKPLCGKLGIKLRWHDMRHFAVSIWIEQGFSILEVIAGHASVQITMERYGHLFPTPDHQHAMAQVEQRVFG